MRVKRRIHKFIAFEQPAKFQNPNHRVQILLKSTNRQQLRHTIDLGVEDAAKRGLSLHSVNIEIDPITLM